jgi:hypothetical protein
MAGKKTNRRAASNSSRRPAAREESRGRSGRSSRGGKAASGGLPLPLVIGGGAGVILLIVIWVSVSQGSTGGQATKAIRETANRYMEAWKSGDVATLAALEYLSDSEAESLVSQYHNRYDKATSSAKMARDIRGHVSRDQLALFEMDEEAIQWRDTNKKAVARRVIETAYRAYFGDSVPTLTYQITNAQATGDEATVTVQVSTDLGNDYPELVTIAAISSSSRLQLVRHGGNWLIKR